MQLSNEARSDSEFIGISLGDGKWIDTSLPCECRSTPLSRRLDAYFFGPEVPSTFKILKSPVDFEITVESKFLQRELQEALKSNFELLCDAGTKTSNIFNGLALLKHRADLFRRLECLRFALHSPRAIAELSLLVNDVLNDGELFASFGHSRLLEQGWLSLEQWRIFQMSRVHQQIDALEQLHGMSDEEGMHPSTVDASDHLWSGMDGTVTPEAGLSVTSESPVSNTRGINSWQSCQSDRGADSATTEQTARSLESTKREHKDPPHIGTFYQSFLPREHEILQEPHTTLFVSGFDHQGLLLLAILKGDYRAVDALLQVATIVHDSKNEPTGFEIDLNQGDGDRNLLLAAVRGGKQDIVKLLLKKGAHVEAGRGTQTALCVAAQARDESMVRLLLDHGADCGTAEILLHMAQLKGLSTQPLNWLRAYVARYRKDDLAEKRTKAMQLRFQFWREHQHIKRTAQEIPSKLSPYSWNWEPSRWEREIELDGRSAWSTSLRVMRGLCRGVLPHSLNDTLLFLALAKNMSSIVRGENGEGVILFKHDLARWQLLFDRSDVSQDKFHQAVKNIWDVDVDHLWYFHTVPSALESFQNLVFEFSNLMADSEDHQTRGTGHPGLLSVQVNRREQLLQTSAPASGSDEPHYTDPSNHNCCEEMGPNSGPATKAEDPIFPMPERDRNTLPTRDRLVLVILMAGATFAAVLAFLLCESPLSKSRYTKRLTPSDGK